MNIPLQQLLPADISNETAFHLVKFVHGLSLALESIYFDQMLMHTAECEQDPFPEPNSNEDPF
jgi:hypothetical protein